MSPSTEFINQNTFLIKNADILPKLSEVLDLIFKKTKPGPGSSFKDTYCFNTAQLQRNGPLGTNSLSMINECLLNHRFNEAAKLLWIMCQDRCSINLFLYKGIMVVLDNLISSEEIEKISSVTRDIRKLPNINKLELQLEYLIYALKKDLNGAEDSYYLEGKKSGRIKKIPCIELLYSAYSALISYITWANTSQSEQSSQTNKDFAFKIIYIFKQLVLNPGIWDIFVLKLIEVLSNLCPSDERVLLLVQKWDELGKNLKKCLKILFAFLDYPINGHRLLGWQLLSVHLHKATSRNESNLMELINLSWEKRSSSWNYIHFKLSNINTEAFELIQCKIKVLSIIQPDHDYIKKGKVPKY